jgi:hypothetical protein
MNRRLIAPLSLCVLLASACGGTADVITDEELIDGEATVVDAAEADLEAEADLKADAATLTSSQQRTVLQVIDNTCGDTWCEGEFNYRFTRMACDFGARRCTLSATVITYDSPAKYYPRACRITGISSYRSMIGGTSSNPRLTTTFFNKVDDCMNRWAATIP